MARAGWSGLLIALAALAGPAIAHADDDWAREVDVAGAITAASSNTESDRAGDTETPEWRLDVDLFTPGFAYTTVDGGRWLAAWQVGVRYARETGHGFFVDFGLLSDLVRDSLLVDAGYLHRLRLSGNDAVGVGLDLSAGLTAGGSDTQTRDEWQGRIGGNVGLDIDYRQKAFVIGLMTRGGLAAGGDDLELRWTAMLRITFGFRR